MTSKIYIVKKTYDNFDARRSVNIEAHTDPVAAKIRVNTLTELRRAKDAFERAYDRRIAELRTEFNATNEYASNNVPTCPYELPKFDHTRERDKDYVLQHTIRKHQIENVIRRWRECILLPWQQSADDAFAAYVEAKSGIIQIIEDDFAATNSERWEFEVEELTLY